MRKQGLRAALIVGLCSSSASLAADEREPIRLTYVAAAGCPSASDFEASVLERTKRARLAGPREIAREYRIAVRTAEQKSVARLEFAEAGGGSVIREVTAVECAEAVRAIALVTALAFDAVVAADSKSKRDSTDSPLAAPAGATPSGAGTQPSQSPAAPTPATSPDASEPRAAKPKPGSSEGAKASGNRDLSTDPRRDVKPPYPGPAPSKPEFELGARGTLASAKAPSVLPGVELFALIADPHRKWLIQLGIAGERGAQFESGPGKARFSFVGGRLEGCFFGVAATKTIELMPCALFEGGAVVVEGFIDEPRNVVDPWFALGLTARIGVELGRATALLEGGPYFPLRPEDRVVFENPPQEVHDVPPIGGFVSLGLTWRGP